MKSPRDTTTQIVTRLKLRRCYSFTAPYRSARDESSAKNTPLVCGLSGSAMGDSLAALNEIFEHVAAKFIICRMKGTTTIHLRELANKPVE